MNGYVPHYLGQISFKLALHQEKHLSLTTQFLVNMRSKFFLFIVNSG
jgi:hypothetical protein